jgi:hypothetical protein
MQEYRGPDSCTAVINGGRTLQSVPAQFCLVENAGVVKVVSGTAGIGS